MISLASTAFCFTIFFSDLYPIDRANKIIRYAKDLGRNIEPRSVSTPPSTKLSFKIIKAEIKIINIEAANSAFLLSNVYSSRTHKKAYKINTIKD